MPEIIEISYATNGQVGPRPRPVAHGELFRFICNDPGSLRIEFLGYSPLESGAMEVGPGEDFKAFRPGTFKFKCTLTDPSGRVLTLGDPADPNSPPGGELEIPPRGRG